MNIARVVVLGIAVVAAGGAIVMVRAGMAGNKAKPVVVETTAAEDVLVAAANVEPGHVLDPASVRWQAWPKTAVQAAFITKTKEPDSARAVANLIARAPLVSGEPLTDSNTVHANTTGFMAATLGPGMRAISIPVTVDTGAGGFILPNDRVDVLLTRDMGGNGGKNFQSETLLKDVRMLAIDQTIQQDKDKQFVVGKTATVELTPKQTEILSQAGQTGVISLALRSLGDSEGMPVTAAPVLRAPIIAARVAAVRADRDGVRVYRAGVLQNVSGGGAPPGPDGQQPGVQAQALPNALGAAL